MKHGGLTVAVVALGVAFPWANARALVSDAQANPYESITSRNVFGLKPPVTSKTEDPRLSALPKIKLTGITTILGRKQALLLVEIPARPSVPAHDDSCILTEGERDGEIEVVAINDKEGSVRLKNHGTAQTLDFVNDGVKLPAGSAPPPPGVMPASGFPPPPNPAGGVTVPGMRQIPQMPQRNYASGSGNQSAPNNSQGASSAYNTANNSGASAAGLSFGGSQGGTTAIPSQNNFGLSEEEQTVLIEAQRAKFKEQGDAESAAMLPSTDITPPEGQNILPQ